MLGFNVGVGTAVHATAVWVCATAVPISFEIVNPAAAVQEFMKKRRTMSRKGNRRFIRIPPWVLPPMIA
jgi:PII-like signaling protein